MEQELAFKLNGEDVRVTVPPSITLVDVLREKLAITSPKKSCERGECGACTVLLDGKPVNACLLLAITVKGREIITVEGMGNPANLHPLQAAFYDLLGAQCGFCTSGMLLSAKALLDENPRPTEDDVKASLSGNICRCTGYYKPVQAVLAAARGDYNDEKRRFVQVGAVGQR